jgi:hypothetical protein
MRKKHEYPKKRKSRKRHTAKELIGDMFETGEREQHEAELLRFEWAVKYWDYSPRQFLMEKKGIAPSAADRIVALLGGHEEWAKERAGVLDKMTESVVMRHIDKLAEVNDTHVRASKLVMTKAIEYLSKMSLSPAKDKKGKLILDADDKPLWRGIRSIDIVNCANAIKTAQDLYRKAMGLPNDESGLAQILEKVNQLNIQQNIHNSVHIHEGGTEPDPKAEALKKAQEHLSYDDIVEFVKYRREQKKLLASNQPVIETKATKVTK